MVYLVSQQFSKVINPLSQKSCKGEKACLYMVYLMSQQFSEAVNPLSQKCCKGEEESMFIYCIPYELVVLRSYKPPLLEELQGRGRKHVQPALHYSVPRSQYNPKISATTSIFIKLKLNLRFTYFIQTNSLRFFIFVIGKKKPHQENHAHFYSWLILN